MAAKAAKKSNTIVEGDRVKFRPSHNKALELVGKVVKVHEEDGDLVDIECEVDGKIVEVEGHLQTAHVSDVKIANEGDTHRHVGDRG
jgi:hypothetical protein